MQQRNQEYLSFLENNLLFSSQIFATENYNGIFIVNEEKGPDYKVEIDLSQEEKFEFYFTRSDKDEILNPWKDKSHERHSLVAGISPTFKHFSAYYLWSQPKGIGLYTGFSFQKESGNIEVFGNTLGNSEFSSPKAYDLGYPNPLGGYTIFYDWKFNYDKSSYKYDSFGMFLGMTIKTFPNTWLLAGAGMEIVKGQCYEGDLYYKYNGDYSHSATNWTYYKHCWLKSDSLDLLFSPQIGMNFITNCLDIGAMVTFPINGKISFDILLGYAL